MDLRTGDKGPVIILTDAPFSLSIVLIMNSSFGILFPKAFLRLFFGFAI